jgi:hypothetical protein
MHLNKLKLQPVTSDRKKMQGRTCSSLRRKHTDIKHIYASHTSLAFVCIYLFLYLPDFLAFYWVKAARRICEMGGEIYATRLTKLAD